MFLILVCVCLGCQQRKRTGDVGKPKGELAFLLQYNNRLPSDVGFLTNHIIERRMANLMKEEYEPFIKMMIEERRIIVDSTDYVVLASFSGLNCSGGVTVDVSNDAIWIDYALRDTAHHFADRTSVHKPFLKNDDGSPKY